jgi:hypothetical protein
MIFTDDGWYCPDCGLHHEEQGPFDVELIGGSRDGQVVRVSNNTCDIRVPHKKQLAYYEAPVGLDVDPIREYIYKRISLTKAVFDGL